MLTKEQILSADDLKIEELEIPEWGGTVNIKTMTGTERDAFEQSVIENGKTDMFNIRAKFCSYVVVDTEGKRLFSETDISALGKKSGKALGRIFDKGQKLNGLSKEDFEELEKNSGKTLTDNSTSS
jgi:hypothetical protein